MHASEFSAKLLLLRTNDIKHLGQRASYLVDGDIGQSDVQRVIQPLPAEGQQLVPGEHPGLRHGLLLVAIQHHGSQAGQGGPYRQHLDELLPVSHHQDVGPGHVSQELHFDDLLSSAMY